MELQVEHSTTRKQFEAQVEGHSAYLSYRFGEDAVYFEHTFVPEELRGRGVAAALVREGLEEARRRGWKVVPSCSYVRAFIAKHPELKGLAKAD